jgi:hypothetical protein
MKPSAESAIANNSILKYNNSTTADKKVCK